MTARAFLPTAMDQLPSEIPIFPLTGALLLPLGHLPLNIFEPRYVAMISDALQTPQRLIGMVQAADMNVSMGEAPVHGLGCAGRLSAFSENDDGTILVTLTGVVRFEIGEELPLASGGYRKIRPDYSRFATDLAPSLPSSDDEDTLRVSIIDATKRYFEAKGFNTDWDGINGLGLVELITSLGMACPFDPMEKQALLEAESVEDRAKTLTQIMTMATLSDSVESNAAVN
jgi:Lon protease-like protein